MHPLYEHLKKKNPYGIPYLDAAQLLLWAYCTLGILPTELRGEGLGRQELVQVFRKLTEDGVIIDPPPLEVGPARDMWEGVLDSLLDGRVHLDPTFPARIGGYV